MTNEFSDRLWKNVETPSQLLALLNKFPDEINACKWQMFHAYGRNKKYDIMRAMLGQGIFSEKELYEKFLVGPEAKAFIARAGKGVLGVAAPYLKSFRAWRELTDPTEVTNCRTFLLPLEVEQKEKLAFFKNRSPEIYKTVAESQDARFYIENFSADEIGAALLPLKKHIGSGLNKYMNGIVHEYNKEASVFAPNVVTSAKQLLECALLDVENSDCMIKSLIVSGLANADDFLKLESAENLKKILPIEIKQALASRKNWYRIAVVADDIKRYMLNGQEWEVFEYFAENNPKVFGTLANYRCGIPPWTWSSVLEHYKDADRNALPPILAEHLGVIEKKVVESAARNKKIVEIKKQKSAEMRRNWVDKDGNLLQLFKMGDGLPIEKKEDYFFVAKFFQESGLSIAAFCDKYKIEPVDGFRDALKRVAEFDPEFGEFLTEFLDKQQREFIAATRQDVLGVAGGTMAVDEMIAGASSVRDFEKHLAIANTYHGADVAYKFAKKVLEHYQTRLMSYSIHSSDPSDADKMLKFKEIAFLIGYDGVQKYFKGVDFSMAAAARKSISPLGGKLESLEAITLHEIIDDIQKELNFYSKTFRKQDYIDGKMTIRLSSGADIDIDERMVEMAMAYAKKRGIMPCGGVMKNLIWLVAAGKIQNENEVAEVKQSLKQSIIKKQAQCKQLEEFMASQRQKM